MKSAITLWIKHAHLIVLQLSNSGLSVEIIASNNLISSHTFSYVRNEEWIDQSQDKAS